MPVPPAPTDDFFRRSHAELVAALTGVFGLTRLDLVEDAVQHALLRATETWPLAGRPDNPMAWLHRVARNKALDVLRHQRTVADNEPSLVAEQERAYHEPADFGLEPDAIADSQLRMIFTCCHPELPNPSQLALALKVLCGFGTNEIADALMISRENAKKRITRAKQAFSSGKVEFAVPMGEELPPRLEAVHAVLYALFNAGYHSEHPDGLIRRELCFEAIGLAEMLSSHPVSAPATKALLAMMYFHTARLPARLDGSGGIMLLEDQDRSQWDRGLLARGVEALSRSASGEDLTRYHLEAGIAAKHAMAASFDETDWLGVLALYDQLVQLLPTPVSALNRAVALAYVAGPDAGLAAIDQIDDLDELKNRSPLVSSVIGGFHLMAGRHSEARAAFRQAEPLAVSPVIQAFLARQLERCAPG